MPENFKSFREELLRIFGIEIIGVSILVFKECELGAAI